MSIVQTVVILIFLIHTTSTSNTYDITYEPNGEIIWSSTSDFTPQQSQSYGEIRLGQVMSIEFDFLFEGRNSSYINQFFRIGADATISQYCDGEDSKYPSMWLTHGTGAILDIEFSSGDSDCGTAHSLNDYGDLNVNASHHIKISLNNSNVEIKITGGGIGKTDPYTESWSRERTPQDVLGSNVSVWWMGNKNSDQFDYGLGTFSNIIIKTNIYTFAPTMAPTQPSINPTYNPSSNPTTPTVEPTINPTTNPSNNPTTSPITAAPTTYPTVNPTIEPTINPTINPTKNPTLTPTEIPTGQTINPSVTPTKNPTINPSINPTGNPTIYPSINPSTNPSQNPSQNPSTNPSQNPTINPSQNPIINPTSSPTKNPTVNPAKTVTETTDSPAVTISGAKTEKDNSLAMMEIVIIGAIFVAVLVSCCIICGVIILRQQKKTEKDGPASPIFEKKMRFESEMAARPGAQPDMDSDVDDQQIVFEEEDEEEESDFVQQKTETPIGVTPGEVEGAFQDTENNDGDAIFDEDEDEDDEKNYIERDDTSHGDDEDDDTYYEDEYYDDDDDEDGSDDNETTHK